MRQPLAEHDLLQGDGLPTDLGRLAFNRDEYFVAEFLGVSIETLRGWRKRRTGPPWKQLNGRCIRYSLAGLIAWSEEQPGG